MLRLSSSTVINARAAGSHCPAPHCTLNSPRKYSAPNPKQHGALSLIKSQVLFVEQQFCAAGAHHDGHPPGTRSRGPSPQPALRGLRGQRCCCGTARAPFAGQVPHSPLQVQKASPCCSCVSSWSCGQARKVHPLLNLCDACTVAIRHSTQRPANPVQTQRAAGSGLNTAFWRCKELG